MTATHATTNRSQSATTPRRARSTNPPTSRDPITRMGCPNPSRPRSTTASSVADLMLRGCRSSRAPTSGGGAGTATLRSGCAGGALDGARQLDARGDVELAEDVAQVRLDRLGAEEELGGDLGVRPAIDDERGDLAL